MTDACHLPVIRVDLNGRHGDFITGRHLTAEPGELVLLNDPAGEMIGLAYVNGIRQQGALRFCRCLIVALGDRLLAPPVGGKP